MLKEQRKEYNDLMTGHQVLKDAILLSFGGGVWFRETQDIITGHSNHTVQTLVEHLCTNYGELTSADIAELKQQLSVLFVTAATFAADTANMAEVYSVLEAKHVQQGVCEVDKMEYL